MEERLALRECRRFLTEIDIARRISNSKQMFSGATSILREFDLACSKFEEYKTCVALVTKNVGCLDTSLALKEQMLAFVCQDNVRETMARENLQCVETLSQSPKIKECETAMRRSMEENGNDLCAVLDQTLRCTKKELLSCGRNTLSYVTNIVTTIKANMDDCGSGGGFLVSSGTGPSERVEVKSTRPRPGVTITQINPDTNAPSTGGRKAKQNRRRVPFPAVKPQCPTAILKQTSGLCFRLLTHRAVKQALNALPNEFVLANFNTDNLSPYCEESRRYRSCLENLYATDDACLASLNDDAFYSFVVAFEDKLCETGKQLEWLMSAGCLLEATQRTQVRRCLLRSALGEERVFCRARKQLADCVMDVILTTCRRAEIKFFEKVFEDMELRAGVCSLRSETTSSSASRKGSEDEEEQTTSETEEPETEDEVSVVKSSATTERRPSTSGHCLRARQIALIREDSYVPECGDAGGFRPMQCDRFNGSCFCVDEHTGVAFAGTANGPGMPLPLCGLKALFTCERLPRRLFCEVDGMRAQKTERWHRRGDRCVVYLHDYCPQQSHIPPIPLRTRSDCERFCLPATR